MIIFIQLGLKSTLPRNTAWTLLGARSSLPMANDLSAKFVTVDRFRRGRTLDFKLSSLETHVANVTRELMLGAGNQETRTRLFR